MSVFICPINNSLWFTFQSWFVNFCFVIHLSLVYYSDESNENSIRLTRDALNSHILGARRSTDKNYYIFAVQLPKDITDQEYINLSNNDAHFALPTYLITYQRRNDSK
jgi:hypothetical protein